jgi:hypothetical protein
MRAGIGIVLFYLASFNLVLAMVVGTCTQGDAGRLWGGALSLLLYGLAVWPLARTSRPGLAALLVGLALPVLALAAPLGVRLAVAAARGDAACDVLEGSVGFAPDGGEAAYAAVWLALSLFGMLAFAIPLVRFLKESRASR